MRRQQDALEFLIATTKREESALEGSLVTVKERVRDSLKTLKALESRKDSFVELTRQYELVNMTKMFASEMEELALLRRNVSLKSADVQQLTADLLDVQKRASAVKKTLDDISSRLPELQQAKTVAVTGRNFKEAARISNEIKDLSANEASLKSELESLENQSKIHSNSQAEANKEFADMNQRLQKREQEIDMHILDTINKLRVSLRTQLIDSKRFPRSTVLPLLFLTLSTASAIQSAPSFSKLILTTGELRLYYSMVFCLLFLCEFE